ncbi:MAG: hypothetical protein COB67_03445 [SAR324 cluster bacterium]|uniref:Calcineurin-like phosphoesterase domain-containing protein n=1 Tax=SAR324 cluster bacterium TaxID=2024889 RepID=A0A2A4T830_9DELT|nr:MAG: hypothetical protein COB67_03445 [SAR324 cluster bacterium]
MGETVTWLHLSDIHFCEEKSGWSSNAVLEKLRIDVDTYSKEQQLRPDLIFVTGDLAFGEIPGTSSIEDQFIAVDGFITELRELFEPIVPRKNVFLVPGNHDVKNYVSDQNKFR